MSYFVSPKKHLGQHFLRDENIAKKIVGALSKKNYRIVIEVGAGTGVLTKYLLQDPGIETYVIEVDRESLAFLRKQFPGHQDRIIEKDFLEFTPYLLPSTINHQPLSIIGNFPYNISSQILFKTLEYRNQVPEVVGMFQKEVAERIAAPPGNKTYGILSVLVQAFYKVEYLFTIHENVFFPPPKVKSAVIRLTRNSTGKLDCDEVRFFDVVKTAFNQRRKTLRNALSKFETSRIPPELLRKRAEQLTVKEFEMLTKMISGLKEGE